MYISQRFIGAVAIVTFVLGAATLFPQLVRGAPQTPPSAPVTVVNTNANPVPVSGALSVGGTVAATQSGEWQVKVTNTPPAVAPITAGGQSFFLNGGGSHSQFGDVVTASALSITFEGGAHDLILFYQGGIVARFPGFGNNAINLALARPISFDEVSCGGAAAGICDIGWIGNLP
jgi:hypothetical protein